MLSTFLLSFFLKKKNSIEIKNIGYYKKLE